ncbi:MAG: DMT family transporter [Candidatus Omnitrophica bacterium]|nr:DMT family transporter [Candidatus Omnitrophota bacterium]
MESGTDRTTHSILKMVGAAISFSIMATFVKWATQTINSNEVVFFRSVLGSVLIGAMILKKGSSWIGKNPKILLLRGVFGFVALSMHFYAISQLNLGTAVMLNYTAPIFVVIFARLLLKERTSRIVKWAILFSFVGLYFLAAPQFEAKPFPILIGILSGIAAALAYVFIRFNDEGESPYTIIFYFTTISTLGSLPLLPLGFHWPNAVEWLALGGVVAGAFFGQVWLTKSIQTAPVSFVLPFTYLTPVFCAVLGAFIWKEYLTFQAIIGGVMIIGSGISIYYLREKPAFIPIEE